MAEPETNLEMIRLCIQRANALEHTTRSIINNTQFDNESVKKYFEDRLRNNSSKTIALLSWLDEANTKA
jgi:hypothetical protein